VSLAIVMGLLRLADALCVLVPGIALLVWTAPEPTALPLCAAMIILATLLAMNILHLAGAYRSKALPSFLMSINTGLVCWGLAVGAIAALVLLLHQTSLLVHDWLQSWALGTALLLVLSRCVLAAFVRHWRRVGRLRKTAVILGAGSLGQRLIQKLTSTPDGEIEIIGVYDDRMATAETLSRSSNPRNAR
jgi:FlaA1/EpsC-like NDP-sugar epimerase